MRMLFFVTDEITQDLIFLDIQGIHVVRAADWPFMKQPAFSMFSNQIFVYFSFICKQGQIL